MIRMDVTKYIDALKDEIMENSGTALDLLSKWDSIGKDDVETIRRAAHTMKSSSLMLGFSRISALCKSLEDVMARQAEGSLALDEDQLKAVSMAFTEVRDAGKDISSPDDDIHSIKEETQNSIDSILG